MPCLSEELSNLFCSGILECSDRKSEAVNCFHKCRNGDKRGDFSCFVSEDAGLLMNRLRLLFDGASAGLRNSQVSAVGDRIFVSLSRNNVFLHGLREALSDGNEYGRNRLMVSKIALAVDPAGPHESPSRWRLEKTREILQRAVAFSGGTLTQVEADFSLIVSNKNKRSVENGAVVFVGSVSWKSQTPICMEEFQGYFSEQISQMSQVRLGEDDAPDGNLESLTLASMSFALLNGNLSKTVNLRLDSSVTSFCKGAVFVLYNYCRMTHVICKYKKLEKSGSYPPLPDLELVDFGLLSSPEEWDLLLNFVVDWPQVFKSSVAELTSGEFKVHRILDFLKSLASKFSAYYRRTRILTEPRPHLLPVLHARIYLVMGLMEVYRNGLDLLNLQPVQNM